MSDRFPTQIIIGGVVTEQTLAGLIAAAALDCALTEWEGESVGEPYFTDAITASRSLRFYDPEASVWQFDNLERFCRGHALSFRRHRCAAHGCEAQFFYWAPGMENAETALATQDGQEVLVTLGDLNHALAGGRTLDQVIREAQAALREIPPLQLKR